jgi:serralysin
VDRRLTHLAAALATVVATTVGLTASTTVGAQAGQPDAGPKWPFVQALMGQFGTPIPLKNQAMISTTEHGYVFRAGQQNSHLRVTRVEAGLKFRDRGTREWRSLTGDCEKRRARIGIKAICTVGGIDLSNPMLVEIWPRLGNDFVDGSRLPAEFQLSVLADAGRDTVYTGAGDDFINAAQDNDRAYGGAGDDWVRTGIGSDRIEGGAGDDYLVGQDQGDTIFGGDGNDRLYGGAGRDMLDGGAGEDNLRQ